MRVLGIDLGRSRTGLALSDPLGITCRPFGIVAERDEERLVRGILDAARREGADMIVVGLPRPLSGGTNEQMTSVLAFAQRLRSESNVPVRTWDERFTTRLAQKGRPPSGSQDAVAACYMLQNYLDAHTDTPGDD